MIRLALLVPPLALVLAVIPKVALALSEHAAYLNSVAA